MSDAPNRDWLTGQFLPGHSGNENGRPQQSYIDKLNDMKFVALELFSEALTPDDWLAICKKQVEKAKTGDKFSAEWVTRWLEPTQGGLLLRQSPGTGGGYTIEPIDAARAGLRALAPPNDEENDSGSD